MEIFSDATRWKLVSAPLKLTTRLNIKLPVFQLSKPPIDFSSERCSAVSINFLDVSTVSRCHWELINCTFLFNLIICIERQTERLRLWYHDKPIEFGSPFAESKLRTSWNRFSFARKFYLKEFVMTWSKYSRNFKIFNDEFTNHTSTLRT